MLPPWDAALDPCSCKFEASGHSQATQFDQQPNVVAYPTTPLPYGNISIEGSAGGLSFPINVRPDSQFTMYDATFNRPVNVSYQGELCNNLRGAKGFL